MPDPKELDPVVAERLRRLAKSYREDLVADVLPFWLKHGRDRQQGGILSALNRDGSVIDSDKSVWVQGRTAWTFATCYHTVESKAEWLEFSSECLRFIEDHCRGPQGKLYFTVTRDGQPLRMRRYVYSEAFAAIGNAAYARATGNPAAKDRAIHYFETYLHYSFTPGVMPPKSEPTRPSKGLAPLMIAIVTAQDLRELIGEGPVGGSSCTQWIDRCIDEVERDFFKPDLPALMEIVGPHGELIDHFDGRTLNPGHAIECAWFILHEARHRKGDQRLLRLGLAILDAMWTRGWDTKFGGLLYYTDVRGLPVQEYWAEMKFWWPQAEAIIATLLAWTLTHDAKYARWHEMVHDWAYRVFPDKEFGEWFGYAQRDGTISTALKGNMWKGPFHIPRMQWYCWQLLESTCD